jgi:hypothetical protein
MRFEADDPANAGLDVARDMLQEARGLLTIVHL